jgi:hypothetical protein
VPSDVHVQGSYGGLSAAVKLYNRDDVEALDAFCKEVEAYQRLEALQGQAVVEVMFPDPAGQKEAARAPYELQTLLSSLGSSLCSHFPNDAAWLVTSSLPLSSPPPAAPCRRPRADPKPRPWP